VMLLRSERYSSPTRNSKDENMLCLCDFNVRKWCHNIIIGNFSNNFVVHLKSIWCCM
jgi:hypothetical protein